MRNDVRNVDVLPGPYAVPGANDEVKASPATIGLVRGQVRALLESSPQFLNLPVQKRREMAHALCKISAYNAALIHDDWLLSRKLGQTPVVKQEHEIIAPVTRAVGARSMAAAGAPARSAADDDAPPPPPAEEFSPRAAREVARVTEQTLNAIAFPRFVADLIKGTFNAIVDASIQQMEAFGNLLSNVAKTVDQFMADNITDNQARDYLAETYPGHFRIESDGTAARVQVRDGADDLAKPDFKSQFNLPDDVDLDDDIAEEVLVPAARRQLARNRHALLSTMVLMGVNRIVVTSGRIKAKMGFRIDATDKGTASYASDFDFRNTTTVSYGGGLASLFGGPSIRSTTSVAYVTSTKKDSSDELNVEADLTGEVDLKFKSDYFPVERFADPNVIGLIQGNTANPVANTATKGGGDGEKTDADKSKGDA